MPSGDLKCECSSERSPRSDSIRITPYVYLPAKLKGLVEKNGRYIVFGSWWWVYEKEWSPKDNGKLKIRYRSVAVRVYQTAQVARIDVPAEDEEEPFQTA